MTFPLAQFVSAPNTSAEVLLSFNEADEWADVKVWTNPADFSLGTPSLVGEVGSYGSSYSLREPSFTVYLEATAIQAARFWSTLARQLRRRTNWLHVQLTEFSPHVWLKTYQATPGALSFENVVSTRDEHVNVYSIAVSLAADPFARGEVVTLPAQTVSNNPASGCKMLLPSILGDAPAPVSLQLKPSVEMSGKTAMFSSVALEGGSYDGSPVFASLETSAAGTDTGVWVAGTAYAGGGYLPVTFATNAGMAVRATDTATVLPVGQYRVLVWVVGSNTNNSAYQLRASRPLGSGATRYNDVVTTFDRPVTSSGAAQAWVDLGIFSFPDSASMEDRTTATTVPTNLSVEALRINGSSELRISGLLYVPVDSPWVAESRTMFAAFGYTGLATTQTGEWTEDGYQTFLAASLPSSRSLVEVEAPVASGLLPRVVPGCTNTLTILQQTNPGTPPNAADDNRDDISASAVVTISYAPRWLYLAAG